MPLQPFLVRFAEPVAEMPRPTLKYDPAARRNRLAGAGATVTLDRAGWGTVLTETREQKDESEHGSVAWEGTVVTMTSESKDHVEDDRILDVVGAPTQNDLDSLVGTKKTDSREQSDPADGGQWMDAAPPTQAQTSDRLIAMLGTEKSGTREHGDVTEGDVSTDVLDAMLPLVSDRLLSVLGTEKTGHHAHEQSDPTSE